MRWSGVSASYMGEYGVNWKEGGVGGVGVGGYGGVMAGLAMRACRMVRGVGSVVGPGYAFGEEGRCGLHTAGPAPAPGHQGPVLGSGGPCEVHWHLAASQGRHPQRGK